MNIIRKIKRKFQNIVFTKLPLYFVWSPWASNLYYFLFTKKFRRESHAVLVGKVKYLKENNRSKNNFYTLIRNTHRIEKGLLMIPRRDVFGLNFLKETVDSFEYLYKNSSSNSNQIKWSYDVLTEYFEVTSAHPIIDAQRERFRKIIANNIYEEDCKYVPYVRDSNNKANISYEEFYKLLRYRRSVRWFENRKVSRELIDKAIIAANQSPSACNRQPFEFRVIDDPLLLSKIVKIPMGIKGYEHNIPMMIVTVGNLDAYFDERDRHVIYVDASLANMSFMLALETLGLSSCPINWPDIEELEVEMEKTLKLAKHQRPIMCMAVGYPNIEGMVAYSEKRNLELIRKYN